MTSHITAEIAGTGRFLPETTMDNFALYAKDELRSAFDVDRARVSVRADEPDTLTDAEVFDRWARQVTGIRSRRILTPESGLTTEDMCARAARAAMEDGDVGPDDLDLIYLASLTCSDEVPNGACTVADRIGAPNLGGFTFNAACAGYVYAIANAWAAIVAGMAETVLVVSGDTLTRYVDYSDVRTAVVFGDGAGAAVLRKTDGDRGVLGRPVMAGRFDRSPLYMVGQGWETDDEPFPKLHMEGGPRILRRAINTMVSAGEDSLALAGLGWDAVDAVIPHQANLRITKGIEKQLDLERGRVIHNIGEYGNMSASTVAVTLDEVMRGMHGEMPDPATLVLTAIGGGYTVAATTIRV
ncbi:MAG: ketoacyl-ACP synthase III [Gemmatimonadota bacterium]|nr:ketoacyl-ACP synthase III [Gemmatimonadota bacterium]